MMSTFHWMIASMDTEPSGQADPFDVDIVNIYASFVNSIYNEGGNLTDYVKQYVQNDENSYLKARLSGKGVSPALEEALMVELDTLQEFAHLKSEDLKSVIDYDGFLPSWDTSEADIKASYIHMLDNLKTRGYGMFASYGSFVPKDGTLVPIVKADPVTLDKLYGYELERHQVLANTQALADGKAAANVLLYGDAGTGKSSTIKACANALFDQGVRLVQFDKYQLYEIPKIIEYLADNPLKFIFFIDDLSFSQNDDDYCYLKGILEGSVTSYSDNIVIYATTNRRHIIAETFESRMGNDLHVNDTMQETMSLSARFGLNITFSKPAKELYLEIVKQLAKEYNVPVNDQLLVRAEAFAIRANGRSPRTAKQFIRQMSI
ncbi:MAG: ATP-binding protein [Firmicutes bacterium]|nr:ATP-binding protein [Bacillota bacterium]